MIKRWRASRWFSVCLEKDKAMRTKWPTRWHRVQNQRSTWQVSPSFLPQQRCVLVGNTAWYASQRSLREAQRRHLGRSATRRSQALCRLLSLNVQPTIWRVRRQSATQSQSVRALLCTKSPKFIKFEHVAVASGQERVHKNLKPLGFPTQRMTVL